MRVVVDTNVVASTILRDRLPEPVILFIIARPDFEWVASQEILTEYREVLRGSLAQPGIWVVDYNAIVKGKAPGVPRR